MTFRAENVAPNARCATGVPLGRLVSCVGRRVEFSRRGRFRLPDQTASRADPRSLENRRTRAFRDKGQCSAARLRDIWAIKISSLNTQFLTILVLVELSNSALNYLLRGSVIRKRIRRKFIWYQGLPACAMVRLRGRITFLTFGEI